MDRISKILIVDDNPYNVTLLEGYLATEKYKLLTANSGEETLEIIAKNEVDLILLDVMMPGMDGFTLTRKLREDKATRLIPIVLVTALSDIQDHIKGIEA